MGDWILVGQAVHSAALFEAVMAVNEEEGSRFDVECPRCGCEISCVVLLETNVEVGADDEG